MWTDHVDRPQDGFQPPTLPLRQFLRDAFSLLFYVFFVVSGLSESRVLSFQKLARDKQASGIKPSPDKVVVLMLTQLSRISQPTVHRMSTGLQLHLFLARKPEADFSRGA